MRPAAGARLLSSALASLAIAGCRVTPPWERTAAPRREAAPEAPARPMTAPESVAPASPGSPDGPVPPAAPTAPPALLPIAPTSRAVLPPPRHVPAPGAPPRPDALPPPHPTGTPPAPPHEAATRTPPTAPVPSRAVPPAAPEPRTFVAWVDRLRRDAASGADAELASHASLLDALAAHPPPGATETTIVRVPELEATAQARPGAGLGFATITSYVEPGGDADALREVYLDFDRVPEFTGKPGTRTLSREPGAVVAKADAIRKTLGFEYGARWTFRAQRLERGSARLLATTQVEAGDTAHMLFTQGLFLAVPEADGLHVAEIAISVMDYTVPALLKGIAEQTVRREMLARTGGLRAHWREYVR